MKERERERKREREREREGERERGRETRDEREEKQRRECTGESLKMVVGSSPLLRIRRHNGIDNVTDVTSITFLSSSPRYITSFLNGSVTLATTCSSNKLQQQVDVEYLQYFLLILS